MLGNDRRRLELAFSLLYSLPGTPMMQYGDEIGIGDDLRLPERECARMPMQWTSDRHGGFSKGRRVVRPVINDATYGYKHVNVADQTRDPGSLLNWTARMLRSRRECPEFSWGQFKILDTREPAVLAIRYDWRGTSVVTIHNFSESPQKVTVDLDCPTGEVMVDMFGRERLQARKGCEHELALDPLKFRWFRVGAADNAIERESP
jgi:maltose alpha-D-glucosyltransferase/alpha-amylase